MAVEAELVVAIDGQRTTMPRTVSMSSVASKRRRNGRSRSSPCCPWPSTAAGRPPLEIAQVHVVAEGRADDAPAEATASTTSGSGLFQVDMGCRPASMPAPTALIGCALVKISASGADADFEILAPRALLDQHPLQLHRLRRAGLRGGEIAADQPVDLGTDGGGRCHVAARPLLDHALQHRDREGDAARLDRLQVDRGQQPRVARGRASRAACWRGPQRAGQRLSPRAARRPGRRPRTDRARWERRRRR